jgi:hypothetical protein
VVERHLVDTVLEWRCVDDAGGCELGLVVDDLCAGRGERRLAE